MIRFHTSRFGPLKVASEKVINFPDGIPGFEGLKRYILIDHDENGLFKWLQAVDNPDVAFLLTDPFFFKPDYSIHLDVSWPSTIKGRDNDMVVVTVMVCVHHGEEPYLTLNLKAPVLFNPAEMSGKQIIIDREDYPLRFRVDTVKKDNNKTHPRTSAHRINLPHISL